MKIKVQTLPVKEIIQDISENLNAPIENGSGEHTIRLPEDVGEGYIRGISFDSGLGFITYNCKFYEDVEIHFTLSTVHPLKFIFCSSGSLGHSFQDADKVNKIETYQNIIVSSSGYNGHVLYFKANEATYISSLEIIRSVFVHRSNYDFVNLDATLKDLFRDAVSEKQFFHQGNYSIKAADIMNEINAKDFTGFLRSVYLESKALEMLVIQIAQYEDDEDEGKLPQILRQSDIQKVDYVVKRIQGDMGSNLSVEMLAKEAGTNVNKLQEGFKYVYDLTVNKYMQHVKLQAAKEMLMTSDRNISEIVTAIGLNNRSYFSKIFKEKYGVNPKYFLKNRNKED
ncbi:transcriptional regulator, AraC family [Salegentibacter echinorum]|uniref:Transcriptional regulator, AraC family n=1 Tax=Salegentibacter echinorum TaxID=1073325 RepID=A0A1M5I780_SALEC|nr:helix-turn-helix transcriptional regulator [Salegentibacter echinorum]SHG24165.1 transcriptional regulator, AraC family [Salegentibacter echinorum]